MEKQQTVYYFQKYKNEETGKSCYHRVHVTKCDDDGLFYITYEREYGYGAPVTVLRKGKGYKRVNAAENALKKLIDNMPCDQTVYHKMAFSRW